MKKQLTTPDPPAAIVEDARLHEAAGDQPTSYWMAQFDAVLAVQKEILERLQITEERLIAVEELIRESVRRRVDAPGGS